MDTLNIKSKKDSITVTKDSLIVTVVDSSKCCEEKSTKTVTYQENCCQTDYISKSLDFVGEIAWPLTVIFIVLLFRSNLVTLLSVLGKKISDSKSFEVSAAGVKVSGSVISGQPDETIKNDSGQIKLPDFKLTDDQSKKILSTLWIHQNEYDKDKSLSTRWSFTLGIESPDFTLFQQSIHRLQILGIVTMNQSNGQYILTNLGYKYCEQFKEELGTFSYFRN
jgi:RNase P/RNase MRP subunit p29